MADKKPAPALATAPEPAATPACKDPKEIIAYLQDELIAVNDHLARILADPKVHATVVRARNSLDPERFKKGDYVLIIDKELKPLCGWLAKLLGDGWNEDGEVVVILPNTERHRLRVGVTVTTPRSNWWVRMTAATSPWPLRADNCSRSMAPQWDFKEGDTVKVHMGSKQIIDCEGLAGPGQTGYIRNLIDNNNVEVECDGGNRVVLIGTALCRWRLATE